MNLHAERLEEWLAAHLAVNFQGRLLDVGAYHGDFSLACLDRNLVGTADLFEPNPANHTRLEALCGQRAGVRLHKTALGNASGSCSFFCTQDSATGSVLPYLDSVTQDRPVSSKVPIQILDQWWLGQQKPPVTLLKIDTQGHDLEVLRGATTLIDQQRPWIVVELIFVALYDGQARPAELLSWADTAKYDLAGLFNEHRTDAGMIAFADAVLVPREAAPATSGRFVSRPDPAVLEQEIRQLHQVCAERLALIEYLHAETQRRQQLIDTLTRTYIPPATT